MVLPLSCASCSHRLALLHCTCALALDPPHWSSNTALHQERVGHVFADADGLRNPRGLAEDVEHKLLESDLTLQMGLLQDKLATEHMQEDSMAAYGMNPYSSAMHLNVLDGGVDEESSEALAICVAIAALALLPQFF